MSNQVIVSNNSLTFLPTADYNALLEENRNLKSRVLELETHNNTLRTNNLQLQLTIDELRIENNLLREKIAKLEAELKETKQELKETKEELQETKEFVIDLKRRLDLQDERKLFSKLLTAIQDLNSTKEYEKQTDKSENFRKSFSNLRKNRNEQNHYFIDEENKNLYLKVLLNKLKSLPKNLEIKFRKTYKDTLNPLIQDLETDLQKVKFEDNEVEKEIEEQALSWWEY